MIIGFEELPDVRASLPDSRIVVALGCFDVIHRGHVDHLNFAAGQADTLVVGLWPDQFISDSKGPGRPVNELSDRLTVIDALKPVDFSVGIPPPASRLAASVAVVDALEPDFYIWSGPHRKTDYFVTLGSKIVPVVVDKSYDNKTTSTTSIVNALTRAG